MLLIYPLGLGTENPFFLLLLISFFFLLSSIERPTTPYFLLSGFFLGLTTLTRSVILPFVGLRHFMGVVHPKTTTRRNVNGVGLRFDDCSLGHP